MFAAMIRTTAFFAAFLAAGPALASSSNVVEAEGAQIRLITAGAPAADGSRDAVLEIALAPGWKTYWIDPGEAGVPPSLTMAEGGEAVPMRLPAPGFIAEGDAMLAGYDRSVRFLAKLGTGDQPVAADVFIGVCEKICVPVSGRLMLDPKDDPGNARDAAILEEAAMALPGPPDEKFGARAIATDNGRLMVDATVPPEAAEAMLFVASQGEWMFTQPGAVAVAEGHARFEVSVMPSTGAAWPQDGFLYVLVADGRAIEGRLAKP